MHAGDPSSRTDDAAALRLRPAGARRGRAPPPLQDFGRDPDGHDGGGLTLMHRPESPKDSSARALAAVALLLLLACTSLVTSEARAKQKNKKNQPQPTTGRIEVSTNPGGYPITIDGNPAGETTDYVRAIELQLGTHTVEILVPNNTRSSQAFT